MALRTFLQIALVSAPLISGLSVSSCSRRPDWNVLIVTFDTTRADHLHCYGNQEIETPNVDRLANEGFLFEQAISPVPITLPSHASIMTGKIPLAHGVRDNALFVLSSQQTTLAEMLKTKGYHSAAAIGGFPLVEKYGLNQGFDLYDDRLQTATQFANRGDPPVPGRFFDERRASQVNESVIPWLKENSRRRFFLWLHYYDPHQPFNAPAPYNQIYARNGYLAEIAYADEAFGKIIEVIKSLGVYERTLVVFTSDHGEGLGQHNEYTHSLLLYDSTLHIPLIIKIPGQAGGRRIGDRVGLIDILPTILELLDIDVPNDLQGVSLGPLIETQGVGSEWSSVYYAETLSPRLTRGWGELRALYANQFKFVFGPRKELFDLNQDAGELNNLFADGSSDLSNWQRRLAGYIDKHRTAQTVQPVELDRVTLQKLMALGYVHFSRGKFEMKQDALDDQGDPPQDRIQEISMYSEAKTALFDKKPLQAIAHIEELIQIEPNNPIYLELLAEAELMLGRIDRCLALIHRIWQLDESMIVLEDFLKLVCLIDLSKNQYDDFAELLEIAVNKSQDASVFFLFARFHARNGNPGAEKESLARCLQIEPDHPQGTLNWAIWNARKGNQKEAEKSFRKVIQLTPYSHSGHFNYGLFLLQNNDPSESSRYFEKAHTLAPAHLPTLLGLVQSHARSGENKTALRYFDDLKMLSPESSQTRDAKEFLIKRGLLQ